MLMTASSAPDAPRGRPAGAGLVMAVDRSQEFRRAARRTFLVRTLRIACPAAALALLGLYGFTIAEKTGLVQPDSLPELTLRKILPEDLAMTNPRYEGYGKDGASYAFTAKTAQPELTNPNVVTLNTITGEIYQADKTRTDVSAVRGIFNNGEGVLDLYEEIDVVSQNGLKAKLTRATILTKEDLLTSPEPVVVEFPSGSIRAKQMTLRQKAREATFTEDVAVELTAPPGAKPAAPAAETAPEAAQRTALFTPSSGPIHIDSHRLDVNDTSKTALFTGSVRARQGDSNLTTPELEVLYEGEGMMTGGAAGTTGGKLSRILAKRPVVMTRANGDVVTSDSADFDALANTTVLLGEVIMTSGSDRRAASERVEIDESTGTILLTGDVVVTQGGNELRGGRLAIDRARMTARLTSPPDTTSGPGRINARLIRSADGRTQASPKAAEPAAKGTAGFSFKTDPKAPVDVTSDALDVDDGRKVAIFRGRVEATQDTVRIKCAELSAFYKGEAGLMDAANPGAGTSRSAGSELTRIEAKRDVTVTSTDGQTATGDWAEFDTRTNKVTMGGNVVLSRGKNMVRGTRLLIDLTTGESKIDTAPQNTVASPSGGGWVTDTPAKAASGGQGRASAVFFPKEMKEGEAKGKSKAPPSDATVDGWSATSDPSPSGAPAN